VFEGQETPDELLSGDHEVIRQHRFIASVKRTYERRPDLLRKEQFSQAEIKLLRTYKLDGLVSDPLVSDDSL
jgi:tRNA (guanine37-N1)-methyltransferase